MRHNRNARPTGRRRSLKPEAGRASRSETMRRATLLAATLACAMPARAVVIECPDRSVCAVEDPFECHCVRWCPGDLWTVEGQRCPEKPSRVVPRGSHLERVLDPENLASSLLSVAALLAAFAAYFLPTLVASRRDHPQQNAIALLNLLLGWTFLGWIAALVWAATAVER